MEHMTVKEILEATGGRLLQGSPDTPVRQLVIDSRKTEPGDLFVPFRGENTDGHRFIPMACEKGAAACLTEEEGITAPEGRALIYVENTRSALQAVGAYCRKRLTLPVIGVTGSVGKTSTREMIGTALSARYRVFQTHGNYNGQLGLPIMLSQIGPEDEAAVLEMGMSLPGEMAVIARMAAVNMAVFTNIGVSHIENLGSRDRICQEKLHITDGMPENGLLILNGDDDMLRRYGTELPFRKVWYGTGEGCDYQALDVHMEENQAAFSILCQGRTMPVRLHVPGIHNVKHCLAAVAAAGEMGIPMEEAVKALEGFHGFTRRLEMKETPEGIHLIDDTYNASPDSMKAALQVLNAMNCGGRKIAVLADMLELGENSPLFHYQTGVYGGSLHIDAFYIIGDRAREIGRGVEETSPGASVCYWSDNRKAAEALAAEAGPGDLILLKGSNGMKLNEIVAFLMKEEKK